MYIYIYTVYYMLYWIYYDMVIFGMIYDMKNCKTGGKRRNSIVDVVCFRSNRSPHGSAHMDGYKAMARLRNIKNYGQVTQNLCLFRFTTSNPVEKNILAMVYTSQYTLFFVEYH